MRMHLCCLKPPSCGNLSQQPQEPHTFSSPNPCPHPPGKLEDPSGSLYYTPAHRGQPAPVYLSTHPHHWTPPMNHLPLKTFISRNFCSQEMRLSLFPPQHLHMSCSYFPEHPSSNQCSSTGEQWEMSRDVVGFPNIGG